MERVALFVAVSLIGLIAIAGAVQSATVTREKRSSTTCASTKACLSPFPMLEEFVTEDNAKGLFAASYEVVLTELCSKKDQLSSCLDRAYCRDVEISYAGEAVKQTLEYICQEGKEKFISESKCFARDAFDFGFKMCAKAVESELTTLSALVQLRLQDSSVYCSRIDKFFTCLKTQVENACSEDAASVITTLTSKVYTPLAIQNFMSVSSGGVTYNKVTTDGAYPPRSVHHKYICAMNLPISMLTGAGSYQFMFRGAVRVDVKGGVKTEFKESGPKTLTLALPQVELVDCPNPQDYIKEGDTETCGCRIKTQGTPPGQPVWLDSNVNLVGNDGSNGVKYLSLTYNSQDQNPTYYCRGVSPLGNGPDVTYTPTFAYGPSQISIYFNSNNKVTDSINKCEENTSFTTYCDIAMVNVNPKPTMIVTSSDGSLITLKLESTPSGFYRYKYKVVPKGRGNVTITCQATNAIFSDLTTTKSKTITVQEPPPSAPVMTATISNKKQTMENGGTVTVSSGDTVQVKCRVDGGFPVVREVTTVCAGVTNVNNGIEATQTVTVKKEDNGRTCSCKADHATGCYHKTSEFTLNVQYTPNMTIFEANSESQNPTVVSANETVKFVCDVEGNPRPTVSVNGQRSGETVTLSNAPSGSYGQRSTGSKVMSCQDTDVYRCVADNGVGDGVARTMSVFVECVPQLPHGNGQKVESFAPNNGTDLDVTISIIGYPEPNNYTLTKVGNQNRRRRRAVTEDRIVDKSLYNVTYMPDKPPKGMVVLTMFGLTSSDSGQYVLKIKNGIGKGFDYTFNVTIAAENNDNGEEDSSIVPIIAGIVAALVVIGIIVIVVIGFKKWRGKQDKKARDKQRMAALDDKPTMRINHIYAGTNNGDDNDEGSERDSDFVKFDNVIYGSNNGVTNDPVAPVYTDYNSIVPTITTATARPKNLSAYSDVNLDENPYEDTDLTNTHIASKPAPPKKPTPALKPSSPATTDVTHKVTPADEVDDVNLYSAVNLETKSTQKKQPVVELVETEDAYGFPLRKSIPVIPEKNFVDGDGSGGASGGGDQGASVKKQKQKPQVPSKKGQMPKNNNNNNANSNHRHSKNNQTYNNMALVLDKDGSARIAVGSEDGTYFNNSNNVDNVYGNTPVPGETDDDNVYGNAAITTDNAAAMRREEDSPGRYKNKDGLNYSYVEILPKKNDSSLSNPKQFRLVDDGIQYSTVEFNNQQ